jgi:hypothetical protein
MKKLIFLIALSFCIACFAPPGIANACDDVRDVSFSTETNDLLSLNFTDHQFATVCTVIPSPVDLCVYEVVLYETVDVAVYVQEGIMMIIEPMQVQLTGEIYNYNLFDVYSAGLSYQRYCLPIYYIWHDANRNYSLDKKNDSRHDPGDIV